MKSHTIVLVDTERRALDAQCSNMLALEFRCWLDFLESLGLIPTQPILEKTAVAV